MSCGATLHGTGKKIKMKLKNDGNKLERPHKAGNEQMQISYNTIYRILKEYFRISVSKEYVESVKYFLEEIIKDIATGSKSEFDSLNELRRFHNLKPLKRISIEHFKTANLIKFSENLDLASQDENNNDTDSSVGRCYT